MKKHTLFLFALVIGSLTMFSGCTESGCTDADAINYNVDADEDDGSCNFEGNLVFWLDEATSTWLMNDGATMLTLTVDGAVVGSSGTSYYWTGAPECGQDGSITITKDLGGDKIKTYTYSVKDQTNFEYWGGTIDFEANTCITFQLSGK